MQKIENKKYINKNQGENVEKNIGNLQLIF